MTSIFKIERRRDFPAAFTKFFEDLQTEVVTSAGNSYKMLGFLDRCIRFWPYRCGAISIDDYLKGIGVDIKKPEKDQDLLLTLELLINLLYWAPQQDSNDLKDLQFDFSLKLNDVQNEAERMLANAEYILEQCCNMAIRVETDEVFPKYYITKRNTEVDATVIAVPKLSNTLLAYFDMRNDDDLAFKRSALVEVYKYMEPRRNEYKKLSCSAISEEFFADMNGFGIRHNTKSQVSLRGKRKKTIYDKLFLMAVYVLQSEDANKYRDEMKDLRGQ